MKKRITIAACALACASCAPSQLYTTSDRATYEAIAPEYRAYVEADAALTDTQKDRRYRTLATWLERITAAEKAQGGAK